MSALFAKPKYPMLSLTDLEDFEEDRVTSKAFERRFSKRLLSGLAVCFLGIPGFWIPGYFLGQLRHNETVKILAFAGIGLCFVAGAVILHGTWRQMQKVVPVSLRSGQPMEVYEFDHRDQPDYYELVYVCRTSRTYFRRRYQEPGGAW